MSAAGERVPLETFLAGIAGSDAEAHAALIADFRDEVTDLLRHLADHPDLRAQVQKLLVAAPAELTEATLAERDAASTEANALLTDLKARWIAAEDPPLVAEIDDRLAKLRSAAGQMAHSNREQMRRAAARIDQLARIGTETEGLERRLIPWAIGSCGMFLVGLVLFFSPDLVNRWITLALLAAPAGLAVFYMWQVRHRTRADTEAEALNRAHFLPHGGLYFPAGENPACVVLVEWTPPPAEQGNPRKQVQGGVFWWTRK